MSINRHSCNITFYENYVDDTLMYGERHGLLSGKGIPFPNAYIVSCIPWFKFESFFLHNHGIKDYYFPSFEAGKITENNGRLEMPLSVTVHHATTEGYHLKISFEELQRTMNNPEEWFPQN